MLKVWSDNREAGLLDLNRDGGGPGASFVYLPEADPGRAVSLVMPKRLSSYEQDYGLHPIFEMNLPEGALRERLRLAFAKEVGHFNDLDVLAITGRSQMGRLRYTAHDADLDEAVPFQSVDEILTQRRDGGLFNYLLDKFAAFSGISGVQPKVLIRDEADVRSGGTPGLHETTSVRGATHIVKFWHQDDYPQLAANEFFCMKAAQKAGLEVPRVRLAEDAAALVVDRFDLRRDGSYRGMEDFCVLNGRQTADKYDAGYERSVFRRLKDYVTDTAAWLEDSERLFTVFVLNCAIRNGDAHLKNFSLIYDDVTASPRLAPVYDLVTTTVYLPNDRMALTLDGRPAWPSAQRLDVLGNTRCALGPATTRAIRDRVGDAMSETLIDMASYAADKPGFREIAARMTAAWRAGMAGSLRL